MLRALLALPVALLIGAAAAAQGFLLSPGDTIEVSVLEDPGLNRQVLIRPDGRVSLPLAGTLEVAGRSPEAVQTQIRNALARDFVSPPTVTVSLVRLSDEEQAVDQADVVTIYMVGEINAPGRYDLESEIDILQAIAQAGGPGIFAARDRIQIRRAGEQMVEFFDYEAVEDGLVPSEAIMLRDGDVVVVPERGLFE